MTVPWEALVAEAYERKKLKYVELGAVRICPVEVGCRCRGFDNNDNNETTEKSVVSLLRELGVSGQSVRKIVKEVSDEAVKSSQLIWIRRS